VHSLFEHDITGYLEGGGSHCAGPRVGADAQGGGLPDRPETAIGPACIMISGQKVNTPNKKKVHINFEMVGTGSACEPGDWMPGDALCPACGHRIQLFRSGCGLVTCPRCSKRWARRAGERAGARVWGALFALASTWKPRHITFELPWDQGDPLDWWLVKETALTIGCTGGVLVVHPWRIEPAIEREWEALHDQKKTTENRYDYVKRVHGSRGFRWAPHVHGIVYGKFEAIRYGQELFKYRNMRRLNSLHAAEGVLTYLFSHTFVPEGKEKTFRYFGICSVQRLKPEWSGSVLEDMRCEKCGAKMIHADNPQEVVVHHHFIALAWHIINRKGRP